MSSYKYPKKENTIGAKNPKLLDEKIKSGKIGGIYCFFGDEEYMIDHYIKRILESFGGGELDCAVFDADNFDIDLFRDIISSYPVITDQKIAVLKNAGEIKFKSGEKDELIKMMAEYKDDIKIYCCIIFKMKTLSEPGNPRTVTKKTQGLSLTAFLKENAELFEFKENPPGSLIKWLKKIAASENVEVSDETAGYLLDFAEMRMYPLKNELDKLVRFALAEGRNTVTKGDVEALVTKKTEMEAFEFTNALMDKQYGKAVESLEKLKNMKEEPEKILGQLARHFGDLLAVYTALSPGTADTYTISKKTGIHEYKIRLTVNALKKYKDPAEFIKKSLEFCRECDLKLKSSPLPEYGLIENLLFCISEI